MKNKGSLEKLLESQEAQLQGIGLHSRADTRQRLPSTPKPLKHPAKKDKEYGK
jgi:hypothetical protein